MSWILSAISAILALIPFVYIWKIIKEVLEVAPNYGSAQNLAHNGWMAVAFAGLSMLIYIGALMSSHIAAFRVACNIRSQAMHHIVTLPGQSVFSFKRFKASIDNYEKWVISYTKQLRLPMMFYTTIINSVFAVLIAAALVITQDGVSNTFLLNLLFYIIFTPIISVTLTKIMFSSENKMIVADALERIDSVMTLEPTDGYPFINPDTPQVPKVRIQQFICYTHLSASP